MKILVLANNDVGLYKFRKELLQRLLSDNEVYISLPEGPFVEQLKQLGCTFIATPLERRGTDPIKDLGLFLRYRKMLKKIRPDVVLTYTIKPNVYGGMACQLLGIPYIVNITGLGSAVENGGIIQKITLFLYRLGLRKAAHVFFQNEANQDFMVKAGAVRTEHDVIPGSGVNLEQYRYREYPDHETVDLVYVGRMMKEKGFGLYIDAAELMHARYPQTRFHVCGSFEDDYRQRVEELIDKGTIIYHGLVDDMAAIYEQMDCTVHPTYYPEGLSNVLLESLACGRPIITTDRPGCREVVEDGINGFVVRQNDLDSLLEKLEKFIGLDRDQRRLLGINGRRKIEKEFDRRIVIDRYLEEIEKVRNDG